MPTSTTRRFTPILTVLLSLALGSLLILAAGGQPLIAYANLARAAFTCEGAAGRCALLTTLQFATPLLLSGLSAAVALRGGFFSIGQAGQMLLGAAAGAWVGARLALPPVLHPLAALAAGFAFGAAWALLPGLLKTALNVHEVLTTLLLNLIAANLVGWVRLGRAAPSARMAPLLPGTRLSAGVFVALAAAALVWLLLARSGAGFAQRMAGEAPRFAQYAGIPSKRAVLRAAALSGGLAGLAGAVEVLGVHYRFVTSFSAVDMFDGLIVALMGSLHPLGVTLAAVFLGGLRAGAVNGLQIMSGVPREIGGALIALMLLLITANPLHNAGQKR